MKIKNLIISLNFIVASGYSHAEDIQPVVDTSSSDSIQLVFPSNKENQKNFGELTLTNNKKKVKLEFEGTGLRKGLFKIVIADDCKIGKNRKISSLKELYSFNTQYGEISSEDNLPFEKLDDIGLTNKSVVLLKVGKNHNQVIACAEKKVQ